MAGGLFNNKPFVINEKCIFFSLICMALFLFKPNFHSNITLYFSLFIIFVVAYVAMAWFLSPMHITMKNKKNTRKRIKIKG